MGLETMMISQSYVMRRFSSLQSVEDITHVYAHTPQSYYQIDKFSLQPYSMGSYVDNRVMNRSRTKLQFKVYATFPFAQSSNAWYGLKYSTIIRYGSDEDVDRELAAFLKYCNRKIAEHDFQHNHIFERLPASDDRDAFLRAIGQQTNGATFAASDAVIMRPLIGGYTNKSGQSLKWIFLTLCFWLVLTCAMLSLAPIHDKLPTKKLT